MNSLVQKLKKSKLFTSFNDEKLSILLDSISYEIKIYNKNQIIAFEGEPISKIGIILKGCVDVQKSYPSGKLVSVKRLYEGDTFGDVIVFSKKEEYPSTLLSMDGTEIIFISKEVIIELCYENKEFLIKFIEEISNQVVYLSDKLKNISYYTIRRKIANYLIEEYKKQGTLKLQIDISRKEMAEKFCVTRPALSNELMQMRKNGWISYDRKSITIKDIFIIESLLT
ncbi:cAMP-binding domain of CRP or a regulatory subunit of cAMP-dependent protein kinases [Caminicella sporogenes DSM 14501]|uniref:cAMP-binding domain of CRP or a regulatory subunit of cAMP-dependent protein kinases n=1 Tax=Caminicella sporogenes DSM 14501 TaxID=1121266 RepID=A0A1M6PBD4_9FIRM|nr:Crp/Fnr family transcriptional regulator [Caminicella sporogenes]RKD21466.1 hypothetical protein BET04_08495 [Caminicella sporogenes]SHK05182.1 cAMP-binding domain of CRP or a regulatory subunit of cAMP-dependent protein kinases [Caminicella sporogenes DSM 14501]